MASSVQNNRAPKYCGYCRTCHMLCWKGFKWLPVLLIVSIVTWSYYAYVYQLCFITMTSTIEQCIYLVIYHILLIMFAWSYWRTIFANIEQVPSRYYLTGAELEKLLSVDTEDGQRTVIENFAKDLPIVTRVVTAIRKYSRNFLKSETKQEILEKFISDMPVLTRTMSGSVRYCNRCLLVKPDRAHHCSICARCVLKMDHHCPWVNNCVCFQNYKFFMLFLGYALLYCLFVMSTCLPYFIRFWKYYEDFRFRWHYKIPPCGYIFMGERANGETAHLMGGIESAGNSGRYHIVFAFFVALMFTISLGSLFVYHCYLVAHNRTTLDMLLYSRRMGSPSGLAMIKTVVDEAFRAPMFRGGADKDGFSLGAFNNFKEVFGKNPKLWALPVFTSLGNGCEFPVRREHQLQTFTTPQEAHGYESMGTTRSSFGDGVVFPLPREDEDTESLLSSERWDRWGERARPFDEPDGSSIDEI